MSARAALFELISGRAAWLAQRQAVLARNVANADTPGFTPFDLEPATPADLRRGGSAGPGLTLVRTSPGHAAGADAGQDSAYQVGTAPSYEVKPAGNGVVLAEQMQKMASTDLDYQLATSLYRRYVGMLRTALGAPQA